MDEGCDECCDACVRPHRRGAACTACCTLEMSCWLLLLLLSSDALMLAALVDLCTARASLLPPRACSTPFFAACKQCQTRARLAACKTLACSLTAPQAGATPAAGEKPSSACKKASAAVIEVARCASLGLASEA